MIAQRFQNKTIYRCAEPILQFLIDESWRHRQFKRPISPMIGPNRARGDPLAESCNLLLAEWLTLGWHPLRWLGCNTLKNLAVRRTTRYDGPISRLQLAERHFPLIKSQSGFGSLRSVATDALGGQ